MARFFWICLGGAAGTGARYLLTLGLRQALGTGFPYGTLAVNVLGSFLLGLLLQIPVGPSFPETLRLALATGVMGGFTTYSAFNQETLTFARDGAWPLAGLNLGLTVVSCLAAGLLGIAAGQRLAGG